jgi:hypothetical protein
MTFNDWSVLLLRALPDKSNRAWNDVCAERIMAKLAELEDEPKAHCCIQCFNDFNANEVGSAVRFMCSKCMSSEPRLTTLDEYAAQAELAAYVAACKAVCRVCSQSTTATIHPWWSSQENHAAPCSNLRALVADWYRRNDPPKCSHKNIEPTVIGPHTCLTAMRCVDCGSERKRDWVDDWSPCKAGKND